MRVCVCVYTHTHTTCVFLRTLIKKQNAREYARCFHACVSLHVGGGIEGVAGHLGETHKECCGAKGECFVKQVDCGRCVGRKTKNLRFLSTLLPKVTSWRVERDF